MTLLAQAAPQQRMDLVRFDGESRSGRSRQLVEGFHRRLLSSRSDIDKAYQGRGYGKQASRQAIQILKEKTDCQAIFVAHHPDNVAARNLYKGLGFVETNRTNYDGDPLLQLDF